MPLNFTEVEKPKEPVEFFVTNTKARPLELEGEVVPELIHKVCGVPSAATAYTRCTAPAQLWIWIKQGMCGK
jgi:hypothetical protein